MRHTCAGLMCVGLAAAQIVHAQGLQTRPATTTSSAVDGGKDGEVRRLIDSRMREMLDDLLREDLVEVARKNLLAEGNRCVPYLLAALKDARFQRMRAGDFSGRLPLEDLVELLGQLAPETAVPELLTLLTSPKKAVRREAAFLLGRTGTDECVAPILGVFAGTDDGMQRRAARGIAEAVSKDKASTTFRSAVFEPLASLLASDDEAPNIIPECLLKLDPKRAAAVLMDDRYLDPSSPMLLSTLEAIEKTQAAVPTDRILRLLDELRPQTDEDRACTAYGLGLRILAHNRNAETPRLIGEALAWGDKELRIMAMRARCVCEGIPDPDSYVYRAEAKVGWNRLSDAQRTMLYVLRLNTHVEDDGFEDFFYCTCGKNGAATVSALDEVGARRSARLLQEAMDVFGPRGPSRNQEKRDEQLAELSREQEDELDRLSGEFSEDQDERKVLLLKYAVKHKEHFRVSESTTAPG
jgi:HEAT repeat protein